MNYLKVYCNLIRKAENRTLPEGYTEKHHTFPKSIFGKNKRIVILTAREHYIAHVLLEKICITRYGCKHWKTQKMLFAHLSMKSDNKRYFNSKLYENARKRFIILSSAENNHFYGKTHTEETKQKMSEIKKGNIVSEKTKEKLKIIMQGNGNGFYGKTHTEETKQKMSEVKKGNKNALGYKMTRDQIEKHRKQMIGKKHSENHIKKQSDAIKGRKWWNNGIETKMSFECPGEGWIMGRTLTNNNNNFTSVQEVI